ncbi:MAG: hypothetical protein MRY79_06750 [Alphaproteobacteria bacterium]|nr:hypothetical protein [Alphaproteobacteria bacterium]
MVDKKGMKTEFEEGKREVYTTSTGKKVEDPGKLTPKALDRALRKKRAKAQYKGLNNN